MKQSLSRITLGLSILLVFGFVFSSSVLASDYIPISERGYANPEALISCEELNGLLEDDNVVIVDTRAKAKYLLGYIPGAVNIQKGDMMGPQGMILTKENFEKLFSDFGIDNDDTIVIYDDNGNLFSARLWWMAKVYGHENVKLLDGAITRWNALGYDTKKVFGSSRDKTDYVAEDADKSMIASVEMVKSAIDSEDKVILDCRAEVEYTGEKLLSGAARKGRIPSAVWLEWTNNFNAEDHSFKTAEELDNIYQAKGVTVDKAIYPHCQSAVRSANTFFVLTELLGYEDVANYDGSWIEWSNDEALPVEAGE
ncbi:MAG: sulfurtransferase [bacterium]